MYQKDQGWEMRNLKLHKHLGKFLIVLYYETFFHKFLRK
uniref:Uncharacterized protein n=1 Tax=Arundo donax TaxID=35708 RepID=A0A0A9AW67_ARUDO